MVHFIDKKMAKTDTMDRREGGKGIGSKRDRIKARARIQNSLISFGSFFLFLFFFGGIGWIGFVGMKKCSVCGRERGVDKEGLDTT